MTNRINYGITRTYLKDWGVQEGLREVYQNYLDYGHFSEEVLDIEKKKVRVIITNTFNPEDYRFLSIGTSKKTEESSRGKHGEGLKMAFLVFLRSLNFMSITTNGKEFTPEMHHNEFLGETLSLVVTEVEVNNLFVTTLELLKEDYLLFKSNLIVEKDKIFTDKYHGSIVDKPKGNIYVGGLFVCHLNNLFKSYDLNPAVISLDRDRSLPKHFELSYHTSKLLEMYGQWEMESTNTIDTSYISEIPEKILPKVTPVLVGNAIEYTYKVTDKETGEEKEEIVKNSSIKEALTSNSYFTKAINKLKRFLLDKLSITDSILAFRDKHCKSVEAKRDFDILLEKLGITLDLPC